ncbi:MAG: hypothetical protein ACI8YQ_003907 [Polaribacter sp.]|jgi:hypothetical protein
MKSLLTLLFVVLFSFGATAQDLTLNMNLIELPASGIMDFETLVVTNNSGDSVQLAFRLERVCLTSSNETTVQICTPTGCFGSINVTTTWGDNLGGVALVALAPWASEGTFSIHIFDQGPNASEWNFVMFDRFNPTNEVVLNIVVDDNTLEACTPTGTNDFEYGIGKAFPNPASDIINISYEIDINEASLNIYNSTGMLVETVVVNPQSESVAVNVADYVNGVYFYNVTDGKGQSKMMSFVK